MRFVLLPFVAASALLSLPASAGLLSDLTGPLGTTTNAPAATNDLDTVVANVQRAYVAANDFTAEFTQSYTNMALGDTDRSSGVVHFLRPGRMRWDYAAPVERYFISDGQALWIYEPAQAQYYTQPLDDSDLPTALRFLMGEGDLARDFEISFGTGGPAGSVVLNLVPREDESHYRSLRFVVNTTTWEVDEATIVDPIGNTNHFAFRDRQTNVGYLPGDFHFEPPRGATRIENPDEM